MTLLKRLLTNLVVAVWGAVFGMIIGYISSDLETNKYQNFVFNPGISALSGILVAVIAINLLPILLTHSVQSSK